MENPMNLSERFTFRPIRTDEVDQAVQMEQICFPPNEAWPEELMRERILTIPDMTFVAEEKTTGRIVGMMNGLLSDEDHFSDDFLTDVSSHRPGGHHLMITGVQVLPNYRKKGIAKEMMACYLKRAKEKGQTKAFLTCLEEKIPMYQKMGFQDNGISSSTWAEEQWHEMVAVFFNK